jgi:DNA-directed RNA polymerase specialized sigma24 family protein
LWHLEGGAALADADAERARTADEVFASLTRRHVDAAYRLAWAILGDAGDAEDAEDAAHDAFAMAWRKRGTLRDSAAGSGSASGCAAGSGPSTGPT